MEIFLFDTNWTDCHSSGVGETFQYLKVYCTPVVVALGVVTNTFTALTYRSTKLHNFSPTTYLTALACMDSIFLIMLFVVWLSMFDFRLMSSEWCCLLTTYFTKMTTFMSLWSITAMTLQRYLQTCQPWVLSRLKCTDANLCSMLVVVAIVITAVVVYLNISLKADLRYGFVCSSLVHMNMLERMVLIKMDMAFNFALPYTILIICNILNLHQYRLTSAVDRRTCRHGSFVSVSLAMVTVDMTSNTGSCASKAVHTRPQPRSTYRTELEFTKISLVISVGFLLCNLPNSGLHAYALTANQRESTANTLLCWQKLLLFISFTRCALNFPLACCSSRLFRKAFVLALRRPASSRNANHIPVTIEMEPTGSTTVPDAL